MGEHMGEQNEQGALTLVQAAERLGVKPATVRMRWKRGKLEGFKKGGRVYVYLTKQANKQGEHVEQKREQGEQEREQVREEIAAYDEATIEMQRLELDRVLRENERLNERMERMDARIDGLLASHAQERDREQVLRQQLQNQLDVLTERLALPAPEPDPAVQARLEESERNVGLLKGGVIQLLRFLEGKKA